MSIKSAIIGLGNIGMGYDYNEYNKSFLSHASSIYNHKDFKLECAADKNKKKRLDFQKKYKVRAYRTIDELLDKNDFSFIVVANDFFDNIKIFEKIAKKKSVKFILYEKPFIKTLKEAKKISDIAKKYKVKYAVNFQRSFNKKYTNIIDTIASPNQNNHLNITVYYTKKFLSNASHFLFLISRFLKKPNKMYILKNSIFLEQNFTNIQFVRLKGDFVYNSLLIFNKNNKFEFTSRKEKCKIYRITNDLIYKSTKILKKNYEVDLKANLNQKFVIDNISNHLKKKQTLYFNQDNFFNYLKTLTKLNKFYEKI